MFFQIPKLKRAGRAVGMIGVAFSLLAVAYLIYSFDFSQAWSILRGVSLWFVASMIILYMSTFIFRSLRWSLMLNDFLQTTHRNYLQSILIGFAGNNILPARGGELLRMEVFSRKTKSSRITAISSIALEKILDAIVLLFFLLVVSLWLREANSLVLSTIKSVSLIFIPLVGVIVFIRLRGSSILQWMNSGKWKILGSLADHFDKFFHALIFLKFDGKTLKIITLSILVWVIEGAVFVLGILAVGIEEGVMIKAIIALCIVNFGILIPSSPGYFGIFQLAVILALTSFGISEAKSLAVAIIIHACQYVPVTITGMITLGYISLVKPQRVIVD